jgi:hypothetical protein
MQPHSALVWRVFHLPKAGNTAQEYEDAFAGDVEAGRFAVADGATESSFAGPWARLLAEGYVQHAGRWRRWLPAAQERWQVEHRNHQQPWYVEAKMEQGAFATLLGVHFGRWDSQGGGAWQARAVGDSCLFQLRGKRLHRAFPIKASADFTNQPVLIGSHASRFYPWKAGHHRTSGRWQPGDRMFLMTDALAQWFLLSFEAGHRPWRPLERITTADEFAAFVAKRRDRRKLRNDDVTLVCIEAKGR